MALSIILNLGLLSFFKYFNFFVDSFIQTFNFFGGDLESQTLNIILPVGISFYTFQTLSYSIDVYRGKTNPETSLSNFLLYVSFFPQLVAGPIEKSSTFLPQLQKARTFDYELAADGARQMIWGFFKKLVVANHCLLYIQSATDYASLYDTKTLVLTLVYGAIYFYADFSAYSDIAIGLGKQFNIRLSKNFNNPFFATNFPAFWKRWHMTLIRWFRDYVFFSLPRKKRTHLYRNIFVVFLLTGLWHGASLNFIIWGAAHGIVYLISHFLVNHLKNIFSKEAFWLQGLSNFIHAFFVFSVFAFLGVFFFFETPIESVQYLEAMLYNQGVFKPVSLTLILSVPLMLLIEFVQRKKKHPLDIESLFNFRTKSILRWAAYTFIVFGTLYYGITGKAYVYFQF